MVHSPSNRLDNRRGLARNDLIIRAISERVEANELRVLLGAWKQAEAERKEAEEKIFAAGKRRRLHMRRAK